MNVFFLKKYRRYTVMYPSQRQFASYFGNYSIKHYLARSCFQLWPKIGDEGDKISREKTGEALAKTVFTPSQWKFWGKFWEIWKNLENFVFWKVSNYS